MAGGTGAAVTVKVTGTVTGVTPVALRRNGRRYSCRRSGCRSSQSASRAIAGARGRTESVNQAALSLAVQLRVPPPVLLMLRVWVAGLAPP